MVESEIAARGCGGDARVLEAMRAVPRHLFLPQALEGQAYSSLALPIGCGHTISAPHMVALMTEALELAGGEKVLEIGTGSGYQAAALARLGARVITSERVPELARRAQQLFIELGLTGIVVKVADGSLGFKETAPYDRVLVTAAAPSIAPVLFEQLAPGGRLVAPVGDRAEQTLMRYTRDAEQSLREEALCRCVFVPLIGRGGFADEVS